MNLSNFKLSTLTDGESASEQRTPHSSHSFTSLILQPQTLLQHGGSTGPRVVSQAKGSRGRQQQQPRVAIISYSFSSRIRDDGRHASKRLLPQQDHANEAGRGRAKLAEQRTLWIGSSKEPERRQKPRGGGTHLTKWDTRRTHTRR